MNKFQRKVASAVAAGAVLLQTALPVFATTTIVISGNGVDTNNDANVNMTQQTTVNQQNVANIENDVDVTANTGDNTASRNTGGDTMVDTGNANVDVSISNSGNTNVADVNNCCDADIDVLISENGDNSDNTVNLNTAHQTTVTQWNVANVENDVDVDANTGGNNADRNTGGNVTISTGNADVSDNGVKIVNALNANSASIGSGAGGQGMLSLRILGNGVDTNNDINLNLASITTLEQGNLANVENDVDVDADTGNNVASRNTGGDVLIDTGDAKVDVWVETMANFNAAELENCLCLLDLLVKIAGNGDNSDNTINANLANVMSVNQFNEFFCEDRRGDLWGDWWWWKKDDGCTDVDVDADTGHNRSDSNTGGVDGGDPSIFTGNAVVDVVVENSGNSNVVGSTPDLFPDLPDFDMDFDFGFNWLSVWLWFAGMFA